MSLYIDYGTDVDIKESKIMYKATIYYDVVEDDYNKGEVGDVVNSWTYELKADTQSELRNKILESTYSEWKDLNDEQMNEYDWCTEYHTSYMTDEFNDGQVSDRKIEKWKNGEVKLYAVNCHILVTEVTEKKASL